MKPSRSTFLDIRGLRYHVREWGTPGAPQMFILHGWMDSSASFQFVVDALERDWHVLAPDWRGYGLTARPAADCYWFPDYLADLERILAHYSPDAPVRLVGHSMGGNIACLYGGVRPKRIAKIANLEGFGLPATQPDDAPKRYARWLDELADPPTLREHESTAAFAARLMHGNARLTAERARFIAEHWSEPTPGARVRPLADPAHKIVNPTLYRLEESMACWRAVTAPVLWVVGAQTQTLAQMRLTEADHEARKRCFAKLEAHTIPDAGHMLHHDQPEVLARLLEGFLVG
ncbi:MAG: alpha/beta hydrolase [Burkholderiales bacterium]|nr:alpha/beta hydrolase [Burkholderiales bacterium]